MTTEQCAHCGSPRIASQANCNVCGLGDQQPAQTLQVGALLSNRFKIDRVLGRGGFGIAYKAFDLTIDRTVAIKEFFPAGSVRAGYGGVTSAGTEDFAGLRAAFLREGRALGQFRENGIVQVFDVVEANSTAYIVMEYLNGETLEQRLMREGPLPRDVVRHWTIEILRSLDKVHASGLLHRDISPTNVILEPERGPVLIDFGAARFLQSERTATLVLKHGYAPPEQYQTHGRLGPWTDIYALSATLARVLTGLVPLSAIDRLSGGELPAVLTERAGDPLYKAILAGLALRSEERVASAVAFRAIIEAPTHTVYAGPGAPQPVLPNTPVSGARVSGAAPASGSSVFDTVAPFGSAAVAGTPTVRPGDATVGPATGTVAPPAAPATGAVLHFGPPPPIGPFSPPGPTVVGLVGSQPDNAVQVPAPVSLSPAATPTGPAKGSRNRVLAGVGVVAVLAAVGLGVAQPWKSSKTTVANPDTTIASADTRTATTAGTASGTTAGSTIGSTVAEPVTTTAASAATVATTEPASLPPTTLPADSTPPSTAPDTVAPATPSTVASTALIPYTDLAAPTNVLGPANLFGGLAVSRDGARLVYSKSYQGVYQLYSFDRASGKEVRLTSSRSNKGWPNISPDGTSVAYSSLGAEKKAEDKIFVAPLPAAGPIAPTDERQITKGAGNDDYPFFSHDGSQVYYTADLDGSYDIHRIGVDGTSDQTVLGGIKDDYMFGLTPDGSGLLVMRTALGSSSGYDLLIYHPATGEETTLTDTTESETYPAFSPDGSAVVFARDIEGQTDLFVLDVATGNEVQLTDTAVNEGFPLFTPSGDGIIFSARSDEGTTVQQLALHRAP